MAPTASSQPITKRGAILFLLTFGSVLSLVALPQYLHEKRSAQWPTTSGVITLSRIRFLDRSGSPWTRRRFDGYLGDLQYRYHVGATDYVGSRLSFERTHLGSAEGWQSAIRPYPVGKTVTVYYDPGNPASAVLEPGLVGELVLLYRMDLFFIAAFATSLLIGLCCPQAIENLFASPRQSFSEHGTEVGWGAMPVHRSLDSYSGKGGPWQLPARPVNRRGIQKREGEHTPNRA